MSGAWKALERLVAAVFGGVRSWETDHDVLVVTQELLPGTLKPGWAAGTDGGTMLFMAQNGIVELASIEVKNLTGPTVAQLEAYLRHNRRKADRDGVRWNALVVKRKAGPGRPTMALLVVPLEEFREAN